MRLHWTLFVWGLLLPSVWAQQSTNPVASKVAAQAAPVPVAAPVLKVSTGAGTTREVQKLDQTKAKQDSNMQKLKDENLQLGKTRDQYVQRYITVMTENERMKKELKAAQDDEYDAKRQATAVMQDAASAENLKKFVGMLEKDKTGLQASNARLTEEQKSLADALEAQKALDAAIVAQVQEQNKRLATTFISMRTRLEQQLVELQKDDGKVEEKAKP